MEKELKRVSVVPMRGMVLFPHMTLNFDAAREMSIKALESAAENDFPIAVPDSCFKAYVRALLFGLTCSKFPTNTAGVTITVVPAKTLCKATNAHLYI